MLSFPALQLSQMFCMTFPNDPKWLTKNLSTTKGFVDFIMEKKFKFSQITEQDFKGATLLRKCNLLSMLCDIGI